MLDTEKAKTLEALIDWLETKPPEATYRYGDSRECLAAQYNQHIGAKYDVPALHWMPFDGGDLKSEPWDPSWGFNKKLEWVAFNAEVTRVDGCKYRTFGDALKLAKEVA
jgi:hypothetical protein